MALEVKNSTIATGSDIGELLTNIGMAREDGWTTAGPIVTRSGHLTQVLVKFGPFYTL